MRKLAPLFLSVVLVATVGCSAEVTCEDGFILWGAECVVSTDCGAPYEICADADGYEACTDTMSDSYNCGGCGIDCAGAICAFGACQAEGYACEDYGMVDCGAGCVDVYSDVFNCGGCGGECAPGDFCADGVCGTSCGFTMCGDLCTDLLTDPYNCGECYNECVNGCDGAGFCL